MTNPAELTWNALRASCQLLDTFWNLRSGQPDDTEAQACVHHQEAPGGTARCQHAEMKVHQAEPALSRGSVWHGQKRGKRANLPDPSSKARLCGPNLASVAPKVAPMPAADAPSCKTVGGARFWRDASFFREKALFGFAFAFLVFHVHVVMAFCFRAVCETTWAEPVLGAEGQQKVSRGLGWFADLGHSVKGSAIGIADISKQCRIQARRVRLQPNSLYKQANTSDTVPFCFITFILWKLQRGRTRSKRLRGRFMCTDSALTHQPQKTSKWVRRSGYKLVSSAGKTVWVGTGCNVLVALLWADPGVARTLPVCAVNLLLSSLGWRSRKGSSSTRSCPTTACM